MMLIMLIAGLWVLAVCAMLSDVAWTGPRVGAPVDDREDD